MHDNHALCGGSGFVTVPHPRTIRDGVWQAPYYTCAVVCDCPTGNRRLASQAKRERKQMTLSQYEARFFTWKSLMAIKDAARSEMEKAKRLAQKGESDWLARRTRLSIAD